MVKRHSPSGSRLNLLTSSLEKKIAAVGAIGAFVVGGCTTSTDALPRSETVPPQLSTTQSETLPQSTEVAEPLTEIYEGEPTRDNWNLDNLSQLTTEWDNLDEKQRRTEVQTFLQANIPGLDMNYFERTPEGMQQMAKNMWDIHSLIVELSFNPQVENVDTALENIITTLSANDEIKAELLDIALYRLQVEREAIGKPYEEGYREYRASCYVIDGVLKTSEDFYFTNDGQAVFATVAYNNSYDNLRSMYTMYVVEVAEWNSDAPGGTLAFDRFLLNTDEPVVHMGNGVKKSSEELYDSIPEK